MTEKKVSLRYARALMQTAEETGMVNIIYDDFLKIDNIFEVSRELRSLTASPVFPLWKKKKIYTEIFDEIKIHPLTMKFIILLLDKGRCTLIHNIIKQYYILYNSINNKVPVTFSTARELSEELKQRLIEKCTEYTQKDIIASFKIKPELRGGIQISIEDWVYDGSIKNQLKSLYKSLIDNK